eukprot:778472-Amphidinium_carterae.1
MMRPGDSKLDKGSGLQCDRGDGRQPLSVVLADAHQCADNRPQFRWASLHSRRLLPGSWECDPSAGSMD